jgi:hypothetical protein
MKRGLMSLAVAVAALALVAVAYGATPWTQQDAQLRQTCITARTNIASAMDQTTGTPPRTIKSSLDVLTPLQLWGRVYFGSRGTVSVGGGQSFAACSRSVSPPVQAVGPGVVRIVASLHETFSQPGRYTLKFTLSSLGRQVMSELRAAQRTYRKRHPHGHKPPEIVFSVALGYTPTG